MHKWENREVCPTVLSTALPLCGPLKPSSPPPRTSCCSKISKNVHGPDMNGHSHPLMYLSCAAPTCSVSWSWLETPFQASYAFCPLSCPHSGLPLSQSPSFPIEFTVLFCKYQLLFEFFRSKNQILLIFLEIHNA
jgi:hypothetical protein